MATVYSDWSKGWTPSGGKTKKYRARLDYTVTETLTDVTITAQLYVNINSSVTASYQGYMTVAGTRFPSSGTYSCSTTYKSSGGVKTVKCGSAQSVTIAKKATQQSVTLTGQVKSSNGSWTGVYMGVGVTLNIPAFGECLVTFDTLGISDSPEGQLVTYGECAVRPEDPTARDWRFIDWYTSDDTLFDFTTPITESITLYAKWKKRAFVFCKVDDKWAEGKVSVKVNDKWTDLTDIYIKADGSWIEI